jgi:hypothetical protein
MKHYVCDNCGFWQRRFDVPTWCPVCEDYRHPLPPKGYSFRTIDDMATQVVTRDEPLPGVHRFSTSPSIGIGSCGYMIETDTGNLHFDGCGWYDDDALDFIAGRGGVSVVAASHPHVYGSLWRIVERFGSETIFQAEALPFCQAFRISFPFDERWMITERFELIRTSGHTLDHTVLYDHEQRRLYCGDALKFTFPNDGQTVGQPDTISTHKAFDAHIPLTHGDVRRYLDLFRTLDFDAIITPWEVVPTGGKAMVMRLLEKQLAGKPFADPMPL